MLNAIGIGIIVVLVASGAFVISVIAVIRGHLDWARLGSRKTAAWAISGCAALLIVGAVVGAFGQPGTTTKDSVSTEADTAVHSPSPSPSPSASSKTPSARPSASGSAKTESSATASGAPAAGTASGSAEQGPGGQAAASQARSGTALALLATLPVKGRAPKTGYARDLFGSILRRDIFKAAPSDESDARLAALQSWIHEYNHHRPHAAVGKKVPIAKADNLTRHHTSS